MVISLILSIAMLKIILKKDLISAGCIALPLWALYLYILTELLSIGSNINKLSLQIGWGLAVIILIVIMYIFHKKIYIKLEKISLRKNDLFIVLIFIIFAAVILSFSYNMPLYHWDSMTYHLTRIEMWSNLGSVAHYASSIRRAVGSNPFAEFIGLHVYVLTDGNERALNLIQAISFLICIILIYGISRKIGSRKWFAIFAATLFAACPIAFVESMTTQNDLVTAVWLLVFASTIIGLQHESRLQQFNFKSLMIIIKMGLCIAFAYLTKPSVFFGICTLFVWLLVSCIRRKDNYRLVLKWIALTATISIIVIAPETIRNIITFGALTDPWQGGGQLVATLDPRYLIVGFSKNFLFNFPSVFWEFLIPLMQKIPYYIAYRIGINADDSSIAEFGKEFVLHDPGDYGCDSAVSPVIFLAISISAIFVLVRIIRKERNKGYSCSAIGAFILLLFFMRYEAWVGRYMVGYFALCAPAVALEFQQLGGRHIKSIPYILTGAFFTMCLLDFEGLFANQLELKTEMDEMGTEKAYYYYNESSYENVYLPFVNKIEELSPSIIAISSSEDSYIYPILRKADSMDIECIFINVNNATAKYEKLDICPDYAILIDINSEEPFQCIEY